MKNIANNILIFLFNILLIIIFLFGVYCFSIAWNAYFGTQNQENNKTDIMTGENEGFSIELLSGNIEESGNIQVINIPDDERGYLEYIIKNGTVGYDYISVEPPKPTVIHGTRDDNNKVMYQYFSKNKITFNIPTTDKTPYILIVTKMEIPSNRDFFLGLDGQSMGAIKKEKSLPIYNYNEYLYPLYNIVKAGYNGATFDVKSHIKNGKLWLNVFVGESGNYVEKIIIFFK